MRKEKRIGAGIFCEVYGDTVRNRILEHFLANDGIDFSAPDAAIEKDVSKPQAYAVIEELLKSKILIKSRVIGKTQLYKLNKDNIIAYKLLKSFNMLLNELVEELNQKPSKHVNEEKSASPLKI